MEEWKSHFAFNFTFFKNPKTPLTWQSQKSHHTPFKWDTFPVVVGSRYHRKYTLGNDVVRKIGRSGRVGSMYGCQCMYILFNNRIQYYPETLQLHPKSSSHWTGTPFEMDQVLMELLVFCWLHLITYLPMGRVGEVVNYHQLCVPQPPLASDDHNVGCPIQISLNIKKFIAHKKKDNMKLILIF